MPLYTGTGGSEAPADAEDGDCNCCDSTGPPPPPPPVCNDQASCKDFCGLGGGRERSECCDCPCGGRKDTPQCWVVSGTIATVTGVVAYNTNGSHVDFGGGVTLGVTAGPGSCVTGSAPFNFDAGFTLWGSRYVGVATDYQYSPTPTPHFDAVPITISLGFSELGGGITDCSDPTVSRAPVFQAGVSGGMDTGVIMQADVVPNFSDSFACQGIQCKTGGCEAGGGSVSPDPGKVWWQIGHGSWRATPFCGSFGCAADPKPSCLTPPRPKELKCSTSLSYYIEYQSGVDGMGNPIYTPETGTLTKIGCGDWQGGTHITIEIRTTVREPGGNKCCPDCKCEDCGDCGDGTHSAPCVTCWESVIGLETTYIGNGSCPPVDTYSGLSFQNFSFSFVEGC